MRIFRKGFNLVELSIVLVILGILITLTVKGKKLIETANWKSDFASIKQINTAMYIFMGENNSSYKNLPLLYPGRSSHLDYNTLMKNGYLDEKWLKLKSFSYANNLNFSMTNIDLFTPITLLF